MTQDATDDAGGADFDARFHFAAMGTAAGAILVAGLLPLLATPSRIEVPGLVKVAKELGVSLPVVTELMLELRLHVTGPLLGVVGAGAVLGVAFCGGRPPPGSSPRA